MEQVSPESNIRDDLEAKTEPGAIRLGDTVPASDGGDFERNNAYPATAVQVTPPYTSQDSLSVEEFEFIATIGLGNSARVMLSENKLSKKLYAIKVIKKELLIQNEESETAMRERRILKLVTNDKHPFIAHLFGTFQSETRLYIVTEYMPGGDLMWHIHRRPFSQEQVQFYAAEICLVLKYLHTKGILYRDLRLDNILLTLDGHIKVTNFGLCAEGMRHGTTTKTFCGNAEFMAPEILLDQEYTFAVDWWALGILIYQMSFQQQPFRGEDEDEIYDAILAEDPLYSANAAQSTVEICQTLLAKAQEQRLGSGPTDAEEVMVHQYFNGINWDDLYHKKIPSPYIPTISCEKDTSNFESDVTGIDTAEPTEVQVVLSQEMQEKFRGFSGTFEAI